MPRFPYHIEGGNDYASLRRSMVQNQIAARGVSDERVLGALGEIPRELFVESGYRNAAYQDRALPIGLDQTISQPYIVALMTEALKLNGTEKVLEIGTGSGYQTAVLCALTSSVITIERIQKLTARASANLALAGFENVTFVTGDGTKGAAEHAPFDAIMVTAASPGIPQPLIDQLAPLGRLVIPVGEMGSQELVRLTKDANGAVQSETLLPVVFVPLIGEFGWRTSLELADE
jgi:protein-L-isoaspartate(D-aspartate) O-methyltransferase